MATQPNDGNPKVPEDNGIEGIPAPEGAANLIDTDYVIGQDNITASPWGSTWTCTARSSSSPRW